MKKIKILAITLTLAALLVTSCDNSSTESSTRDSSTELSTSDSEQIIYEKPVYDEYDNSLYEANVDSEGYSLIDVYGLNDFHGALARNEVGGYPGIPRRNKYLLNQREHH